MVFVPVELDNDAAGNKKLLATLFPEIARGVAFCCQKKLIFFCKVSPKISKISYAPKISTGGSPIEISDKSMLLVSDRQKFRMGPSPPGS